MHALAKPERESLANSYVAPDEPRRPGVVETYPEVDVPNEVNPDLKERMHKPLTSSMLPLMRAYAKAGARLNVAADQKVLKEVGAKVNGDTQPGVIKLAVLPLELIDEVHFEVKLPGGTSCMIIDGENCNHFWLTPDSVGQCVRISEAKNVTRKVGGETRGKVGSAMGLHD